MKLKYLVLSIATALVLGVSGLPSHQLTAKAGEMSQPPMSSEQISHPLMNDGEMSKGLSSFARNAQ